MNTTHWTVRLIAHLLLLVPFALGTPARAADDGYTYLPTGNVTDGRFLSVAGTTYQTLSHQTMVLKFVAPANATTLEIGIFDGESAGTWDYFRAGTEPVPPEFTLFADPNGNDTGIYVVDQWHGTNMPDNQWFDLVVPVIPQAKAADGSYIFSMHVRLDDPVGATWSNFKVRTTGRVSILPSAFSVTAPLFGMAEGQYLYPNWASGDLVTTTYDGSWDFYVYVPKATQFFSVWDGDFDRGNVTDAGADDTNDPDTPGGGSGPNANFLPEWAINTPAHVESVAYIQGWTDGVRSYSGVACPGDDREPGPWRRSPAIEYTVTTPAGQSFRNDNPSGNLEWEQFKISTFPFDRSAMDYHSALLPQGVYQVHVDGMDLANLNAWHFFYEVLGVCINGQPCNPPPPPPPTGVGTVGYWRNHPEAWPVTSLTIGGVFYTSEQLMAILSTPVRRDVTISLAQQLIAAELSLLAGNPGLPVQQTIIAADAWLATYPIGSGVPASSPEGTQAVALAAVLENYNSGRLGEPHR